MNDRMKEMYKSGGLLKALLKDPAQRKMAMGMLNNMEMGGKMDYGTGGAMKYRMGGNMPGEDEEVMLDQVNVVDSEGQRSFKSRLFKPEGLSNEDYMRERSNLGRELADNLMGGSKPVSDKVVRALVGEEVQLSDIERKELGYLRDKNAASMLTDLQLERGLLEQGYIDKKSRTRVSPEMMSEAERRGLGLKADRAGLDATYQF